MKKIIAVAARDIDLRYIILWMVGAIIIFVVTSAHADPILNPEHVKYTSVIETEHDGLASIKEDIGHIESMMMKRSTANKGDVIRPKMEALSKSIVEIMPNSAKLSCDVRPMPGILSPESGMRVLKDKEKKD